MIKIYSSLEQRLVAYFYLTMPKCVIKENNDCTKEEQENLYQFIYHLYETLFNDPLILFTRLNEDKAFNNPFTTIGSPNPKLLDIMRLGVKTIEEFLEVLMDMGKRGIINHEELIYDGKVKGRIKNLLSLGNLTNEKTVYTNNGKPFMRALRWFAKQENINIRRFSACAFDEKYDYVSNVLSPFLEKEEGAMKMITDWLEKNNYHPVCYLHNSCKVDYVKNVDNRVEKIGLALMGDHNHLGFCMEYRYMGYNSTYAAIRILNYREILKNFDELDSDMQEYIIKRNKQCDNCRYCVQTDKTKMRPKVCIVKQYEGKSYALCPLYQSYNFSYSEITKNDAINIIKFMALLEKYNYVS